MGIHNHQPVGNFGWVIEKINEEAYRPFFRILSDYPKIKFSLHLSGSLCEWYEANDRKLLDLIGKMITRGQVEILAGGFYEPILVSIPRRDRLGQIHKFQKYLKKRFGVQPKGLWLAERVWESDLTQDLADCGIEYVLVDDRHFLVTGFQKDDLHRYYYTESNGCYLKVFPIDMTTRGLIPFKPPKDTRAYLSAVSKKGKDAVFYFDDGEKFGAWPGTHDSVYKKGWLGDFLTMLTKIQGDFLQIKTYSEALQEIECGGLCHLPSASYSEMEDWSLPPKAFKEIRAYRSKVEKEFDEPSSYIRGGIWKNFLVKYPEARDMHAFMLEMSAEVSKAVKKAKPLLKEKLTGWLYQAQCNDAYWHGVFGGLYLPHLRHGIWSKLCELKRFLNRGVRLRVRLREFVGVKEALFDSQTVSAQWRLSRGGVISRFLFLKRGLTLSNTLARHEEGYHDALREMIQNLSPSPFSPLLEGRVQVRQGKPPKESGNILFYDREGRDSFMDCFFERRDASKETFERRGLSNALCPETDILYRLKENDLCIEYSHKGWHVEKTVRFLPESGFQVTFRIKNTREITRKMMFGTEINFHLPDLKERDSLPQAVSFWDDTTKTRLRISSDKPGEIWQYPIETYHQSESGCERTYQGTCVMPIQMLKLSQHDEFKWVVKIELD